MTNKPSNRKIPVTHINIARVTIEFETPFHIGTGDEGDVSDAAVVCDVNGLPSLPGTSLAGVMRASFSERFGPESDKKLFGYQEKKEGEGSKMTISWGCIHDCHDIPVEGLVDGKRLNDPVLANACNPTLRDHVRINHLGASSSEEHGKFDELAVCKGHRFTFECMMQGIDEDQELWNQFVDLLSDRSLRIGGKTRRGFGAFQVIRLQTRVFNLSKTDDFKAFTMYPARLDVRAEGLINNDCESEILGGALTRTIVLKPLEYWMFGGGEDVSDDGFEADMAPVRDRAVNWKSLPATIEDNLVVLPGSSIKGALVHRVAYHYNRLTGFYGDEKTPEEFAERTKRNPGIEQVFGFAKEGKGNESKGLRGRILIDDIYIDTKPESQVVHHVSIDRFTGGARTLTGGLFSERPFWQGPDIPVTIRVTGSKHIDEDAMNALNEAISDLCESRLALGGGTGRGLGFFTKVDDTGWIESDVKVGGVE
jgi:CRISPR/Cas system CSM-associated protein Csm3 (group 7 of RAMP superfamily)